MPEVGGIIIVPNLDEFQDFDIANIALDNRAFVEKMFEVGGFNKKALINGSYSIEEAILLGGYIKLSVFGPEWLPVAASAMRKDRFLELYAVFNHEYGSRFYFARNAEGNSFHYWYEEDGGDESEQDDFDVGRYVSELQEKEKLYLSTIPSAVQMACEGVLPEKPMFLDD
ncbi:MAG: hypothetical protein PVI97_10735 [Candidatus Thiodiazotropha sp.]|jgi:hypothetical protein